VLGVLVIFSVTLSPVGCAVIIVASGYIFAMLTAYCRAAEFLIST